MRLTIAFVILVLVSWASSLWAAGDAKAGKSVYDAKCKVCHGATGEGNPALAKTLKVEFKPLASKETQAKTDAEIEKQITKGGGKMKPVTALSAKQVADVIAFVRSLAKS